MGPGDRLVAERDEAPLEAPGRVAQAPKAVAASTIASAVAAAAASPGVIGFE
jgi:hypothetical protein